MKMNLCSGIIYKARDDMYMFHPGLVLVLRENLYVVNYGFLSTIVPSCIIRPDFSSLAFTSAKIFSSILFFLIRWRK